MSKVLRLVEDNASDEKLTVRALKKELPRVDGLEVLRRIRGDQRLNEPPPGREP